MDLDKSIIATLSYYGAMQWPLSPMEVHERLIPAARLGGKRIQPSLAEIFECLGVLVSAGNATQHIGLYTLPTTSDNLFSKRVEREKETASKWRLMRKYVWWLQAVPYARALFASGSLASGMATTTSDWDMFVVARAGRLYTARTFSLATAFLMGRLRTKRHAVAPDRFCFNHFVTTDGLQLRYRGIFMAHAMHAMVAVHDPLGYLDRLRQANRWTSECIAPTGQAVTVRRVASYSRVLGFVRRAVELVLDTWVGTGVERVLQAWQQRRILENPTTHARGGRVVADHREIEFHPHSFERTLLDRYNAALAIHGLGSYAERDSGLTR